MAAESMAIFSGLQFVLESMTSGLIVLFSRSISNFVGGMQSGER